MNTQPEKSARNGLAKINHRIRRIKQGLDETVRFTTRDMWNIHRKKLPRHRAFLIRVLRIVVLTIRGLSEDRCHLRASSLTFYSLLSIVPVLAMAFGIAKGFGFERALRNLILEQLAGQEEVARRMIEFSQAMLENVKGGVIAGIGVILLFYTIIKILSHIENAFNDIWGGQKPRNIYRKITDYLSVVMICPVLFLASSTATVIIASGVKGIVNQIVLLGPVSQLIFFLLKFLPYCVLWILFTFLYMFMPNTRVRFTSALIAGIVAGTLYNLFQAAYILFQVNMSRYNAIYGSFAALPLFFLWLQYSWLIVLFGAEISFAHQNADTYEYERECLNVSHAYKTLLSLRVAHLLIKNFNNGVPPWTCHEISQHLEIPIRLVTRILRELTSAGVLTEANLESGRDTGYQPGRDPQELTVKAVLDALEKNGSYAVPVAQSPELEALAHSLKSFGDIIEASPPNLLLKEI